MILTGKCILAVCIISLILNFIILIKSLSILNKNIKIKKSIKKLIDTSKVYRNIGGRKYE